VEIFVYSRAAIERLPPHDVPHVIVSVTSGDTDVAVLPSSSSCRGILRLVFSDIGEEAGVDGIVFTREHARTVWEFLERHRAAITRLVVHCDAGLSRSPAIAAAVAKAWLGDDNEFFRRYLPNQHVYRTLLAEWTARGSHS
jgi:predicted protein tyrosine phosphatase